MGAPRIRPDAKGMSDEKYQLCCALIDLLNQSGLTNLQVLEAAKLDMVAQTFSRHLRGESGPSEEVVRAVVMTVMSEGGIDVTIIHQRFAPLRPFLGLERALASEDRARRQLQAEMLERVARAVACADEYLAMAILDHTVGSLDGDVAAVMAQLARTDSEGCAALLVAYKRFHDHGRVEAVLDVISRGSADLGAEITSRMKFAEFVDESTATGDDLQVALDSAARSPSEAITQPIPRVYREEPVFFLNPDDQVVMRLAALVRSGRMEEAYRAWWYPSGTFRDPVLHHAANILWAVLRIERDGFVVAAQLLDRATHSDLDMTIELLVMCLRDRRITASSELRRCVRALHPATFRRLSHSPLIARQDGDPGNPGAWPSRRVSPHRFLQAADTNQLVTILMDAQSSVVTADIMAAIEIEPALRLMAASDIDGAAEVVHRAVYGIDRIAGEDAWSRDREIGPFAAGVAKALCADYERVSLVLEKVTIEYPNEAALLWEWLFGQTSAWLVGAMLDKLGHRRPAEASTDRRPNPPGSVGQSDPTEGALTTCFASLLKSRWEVPAGNVLMIRSAHTCPSFTARALVRLSVITNPEAVAHEKLTVLIDDQIDVAAVVLDQMCNASRESAVALMRDLQAPRFAEAANCCRRGEPEAAARALMGSAPPASVPEPSPRSRWLFRK
ncbi:hypothetical protein ACFXO9_31350 [Nocardia tengchongensis]|uniref:hypothetical protein n=1 Tax=Nocardia tengchongensis TaxID=2055889 RepID=UPI003690D228